MASFNFSEPFQSLHSITQSTVPSKALTSKVRFSEFVLLFATDGVPEVVAVEGVFLNGRESSLHPTPGNWTESIQSWADPVEFFDDHATVIRSVLRRGSLGWAGAAPVPDAYFSEYRRPLRTYIQCQFCPPSLHRRHHPLNH